MGFKVYSYPKECGLTCFITDAESKGLVRAIGVNGCIFEKALKFHEIGPFTDIIKIYLSHNRDECYDSCTQSHYGKYDLQQIESVHDEWKLKPGTMREVYLKWEKENTEWKVQLSSKTVP